MRRRSLPGFERATRGRSDRYDRPPCGSALAARARPQDTARSDGGLARASTDGARQTPELGELPLGRAARPDRQPDVRLRRVRDLRIALSTKIESDKIEEMVTEFDELRTWFESVRTRRPDHHYQLLGLELFETRADVIEAAATRIIAFLEDSDATTDRQEAQRLLPQVVAAQLCLLGPAKKRTYDAQLRAILNSEAQPDEATGAVDPGAVDTDAALPLVAADAPTDSDAPTAQGVPLAVAIPLTAESTPTVVAGQSPAAVSPPSTAESVDSPIDTSVAAPIIKVEAVRSRGRAVPRLGGRVEFPRKLDLPQDISTPASPASAASELATDTGQADGAGTEPNADEHAGPAPIQLRVGAERPASLRGTARGAGTRPIARRASAAAKSMRRQPARSAPWAALGACALAVVSVVALSIYLLDQPSDGDRATRGSQVVGRRTSGMNDRDLGELPPMPTAATTDSQPARSSPPPSPPPSPSSARSPSAGPRSDRIDGQGYSAAEAARRRKGIDSFAAMGRSEEQRLHGGAPIEAVEPSALPVVKLPDAPTAAAPVMIGQGLLAHWTFEVPSQTEASDGSSHNRTAKLDGRPGAVRDGLLGAALRLDGRDDCLHVPDGTLRGQAGTISLWFRTKVEAGTTALVTSAGDSARLRLVLSDGRLAGGFGPALDREPIYADALLRPKAWQHAALTWRAGGDVVLYLDGRAAGRHTAVRLPDPVGVVIGKDATAGRYSSFDVDEIRLFDRALADNEVVALVQLALP